MTTCNYYIHAQLAQTWKRWVEGLQTRDYPKQEKSHMYMCINVHNLHMNTYKPGNTETIQKQEKSHMYMCINVHNLNMNTEKGTDIGLPGYTV